MAWLAGSLSGAERGGHGDLSCCCRCWLAGWLAVWVQVAAHYHFVPKLEEENICKPWLTVKPRFGMLLPGDAVEISFTILVDTKTAQVDPHSHRLHTLHHHHAAASRPTSQLPLLHLFP